MSDDDDVSDLSGSFSQQTMMLRDLDRATKLFGRSVTEVFSKGVTEGKRFEDVLKGIGLKLSQSVLKQSLKPVEAGLSNLLSQGFSSFGGAFGNLGSGLGGGLGGFGEVQAFAKGGVIGGGVVGQPTYFGLGSQVGLMGEAGAEAILPLSRGPDGKLGVQAGGAGAQPVNVTVNISTPDAESFRRSEGQVSAALARAVSRGRRTL